MFLNGIRLGEYGLDPDNVIEEITEKCVKGRKNYTVISARRPDIPAEKFIEWTRFMVEHEIYFQYAWGQREPSPFTTETLEKIKEIGGKYFLGIELPEFGSIFGCAGKGYVFNAHFHNFDKLSEGKEAFIKYIKDSYASFGFSKDTDFSVTEATGLISYLTKADCALPSLETLCGNVEIMTPLVRGSVKAAHRKGYINYVAHEWYGGVDNEDTLKKKRLRMVYNHSYMNGATGVILESGDLCINSHGMREDYNHELPVFYRNMLDEFSDFVEKDNRPDGKVRVRVAFAQGNNDGWSPWNSGSSLWNNHQKESWGYSAPEFTWRIINEINTKRSWCDVHNFGKYDLSGAPGYGSYDIINVGIADIDTLAEYDYLIFTGHNTMTEEIYDKLLKYVKGGGTLFMTAAHLNASDDRSGELALIKDGKVSELFGLTLDSARINRTNSGIKFQKSICPEVYYSADAEFDPLFSSGYANYIEAEMCGASKTAYLSNSFIEKYNTEGGCALTEYKCGNGYAVLLCSVDYPGAGATYELYRTVVRELLNASHRTADVKVIASDRIRFNVWDSGDVYLLNTDFDLPSHAIIEKNGKKYEFTLDACEIKHIILNN